MASLKKVGPATVEVASGRPADGDRPGASPIYRNVAAADELPSTVRRERVSKLCIPSIYLHLIFPWT